MLVAGALRLMPGPRTVSRPRAALSVIPAAQPLFARPSQLRLYAVTADALIVGAILDDVGGMLLIWLPLALMCLMVYFLWRVVKLTPRVNPQRPASGQLDRLPGTTWRA